MIQEQNETVTLEEVVDRLKVVERVLVNIMVSILPPEKTAMVTLEAMRLSAERKARKAESENQ